MGIIWKRAEEVKEGEVLGEDVYDSNSFILLMKKQTVLDESDIKQLLNRGISWIPIYVDNEDEFLDKEYYEAFRIETVKGKKSFSNQLPPVLSERVYDEYIEGISNFIEELKIGSKVDVSKVTNTCIGIIDHIKREKTRVLNLFSSHNLGYLRKHLVNTSILSIIMGDTLNLPRYKLISVAKVALLHDIGWAFIENDFSDIDTNESKSFPLDLFKQHVMIAINITKKTDENFLTLEEINGILQHHERFDGKGIPYGRKGKAINWISRLIQIADAYDSLTSAVLQKEPIKPYQAVHWIINRAGIFYDPEFVRLFFRICGVYPTGTRVELNDGRIATVIKANPNAPLKPVILVEGLEVDLWKSRDIWIRGVVLE